MTALYIVVAWLFCALVVAAVFSAVKRADARASLESHLADVAAAAAERLASHVYTVDGVSLVAAVVTEYEATLTTSEADEAQRRMAFGLVECALARAFMHPAPIQARA